MNNSFNVIFNNGKNVKSKNLINFGDYKKYMNGFLELPDIRTCNSRKM